MDPHVGTTFDTIVEAKAAIKVFMADSSESWKSTHSDTKRFNIICKQQRSCTFRIRITNSKKKGVSITHMQPHSCNPTGHSRASNTNSLEYLIPHHRATIRDDPAISAKQIQSAERLRYFNNIPYLQAYRVKQAVLIEMWGNESESFALFPDYITRFKAVDRSNRAYISTLSNGTFEAAFFCPRGLRNAGTYLRGFTAIDRTHTKSR
jgi:MuDR family transposase